MDVIISVSPGPLPDEVISKFEQEHGFVLPEDHRLFLLAEHFKAQAASDASNMHSFGSSARVLFFLRRYTEANDYFSKALRLPGSDFYKADAEACQEILRTMLSTDATDTCGIR